MSTSKNVESLCSLLEASIKMQINAVTVVGAHPMRSELIGRAKQIAQEALSVVDKFQTELISCTEEYCTHALESSVMNIKETAAVSNMMPEVEVLKEMSHFAKSFHSTLTKQLSSEEILMTAYITQLFSTHKVRIQALIAKIDKL